MAAAGGRLGNIKALSICFIFLVSGLIWLQFSSSLWMLITFSIIHGFAHGGVFAVISPILAELFGTVSHGLIFGIVTFISSIGAAPGPVTAGYLFDVYGNYGISFMILAGLSLAGLFATLTLKPVYKERSLSNGLR